MRAARQKRFTSLINSINRSYNEDFYIIWALTIYPGDTREAMALRRCGLLDFRRPGCQEEGLRVAPSLYTNTVGTRQLSCSAVIRMSPLSVYGGSFCAAASLDLRELRAKSKKSRIGRRHAYCFCVGSCDSCSAVFPGQPTASVWKKYLPERVIPYKPTGDRRSQSHSPMKNRLTGGILSVCPCWGLR